MNLNKIGTLGENTTVKYLKKNGYKIIDRNYSCRFGEIDIIARQNEYIAFVEVKARGKDALFSPIQAVTFSKQKKIKYTAELYLSENDLNNLQPRFDVAEIFVNNNKVDKINYIENAF